MPIYQLNVLSPAWVPVKSLSKGTIFALRQYIYDAKKSFGYKNDKKFLRSVEPNATYEKPYLYTYRNDDLNPDPKYGEKLRALLTEANSKLSKSELKTIYRFDIFGTWNEGMIIIMKSTTKSDKKGRDINRLVGTQFTKDFNKEYIKQTRKLADTIMP